MSRGKYRAWDEECEVMYYSDQEYDDCHFGFNEGVVVAWLRETEPQTLEEPAYDYGKAIDVEQNTGFKDKDFWESDILESQDGLRKYIIQWDNAKGGWYLRGIRKAWCVHGDEINWDEYKAMGDIHQNPQLLGE